MINLLTGVVSITTTMDAAPENLLHAISCKCTTGCATGGCSCKKAGLRCSAICKHCVGTACENTPELNNNEEDIDDECENLDNLTLLTKDNLMDEEDDDDDTMPIQQKRAKC